MSQNIFGPRGNTSLIAVTQTASTGAQFASVPTGASQVQFVNAGPNQVYVAQAATATNAVIPTAGTPANGMPIPAGAICTYSIPPLAYLSFICDTGKTATLYVTRGEGY